MLMILKNLNFGMEVQGQAISTYDLMSIQDEMASIPTSQENITPYQQNPSLMKKADLIQKTLQTLCTLEIFLFFFSFLYIRKNNERN